MTCGSLWAVGVFSQSMTCPWLNGLFGQIYGMWLPVNLFYNRTKVWWVTRYICKTHGSLWALGVYLDGRITHGLCGLLVLRHIFKLLGIHEPFEKESSQESSHLGGLHHYTWYHQISIHKRPPHNLTFYYIQTKVTSLLALDKLLEPRQSFLLHGLLWPVLRVISCFRQSLGKVPHVTLFHLEKVIQRLLVCLWVFVLEHGAVHRSGLGL